MFTRKVEDFVCEHCGTSVTGTGYTDHCPKCLWSKHVDVEPGDRAATCHGMMRPVNVSGIVDRYVIAYECTVCGHKKNNKVQDTDDGAAIVELARTHAEDRSRS